MISSARHTRPNAALQSGAGRLLAGIAGLLAAWATAAAAADGGALPFDIHVRNETSRALQCQVLLAHWHSRPAVELAPGSTAQFRLRFHARIGEVTDGIGAGPPVERLYCGLSGNAWSTRADIDFGRMALLAASGHRIDITCRLRDGTVACR